ncbi:MAG: hypothetical protein II776_00190, partial [Clostridia bacterium]|nr:hypothetical protein [Clostridia bacterium]
MERRESKAAPAAKGDRNGKGAIGAFLKKVMRKGFSHARALWRAARAAGKLLTGREGAASAAAALGLTFAVPAVSLLAASASFPPGVYPAGFALISAAGGAGRNRVRGLDEKNGAVLDAALVAAVFLGAGLSCLFMPRRGFWYFLFYTALLLARAGISGGRFDNSTLSRVTLATAGGAGLGLLNAFLEGFTLTSVAGAMDLALTTPVLTYLLCGFYTYASAPGLERSAPKRRVYLDATAFALLFLCVFTLRNVKVLGTDLAWVLGTAVTMTAAYRSGALYGGGCGLICGMASVTPSLSPALALAGFFAGLFFDWSVPVGTGVSFLVASGWAVVSGQFALFGQVTVDHLAGLALFFPAARFLPRRAEKEPAVLRESAERESVRRAKTKLKEMGQAFSSLSEVFYTVSDTMKKPQLTETSRLISDCCRDLCSRCPISSFCWGDKQSETGSSTVRAAARLLSEGAVRAEDFSTPFTTRCPNLKELVSLVNRRYRALAGTVRQNNRTTLLAGEYSSVARLFNSCAGDVGKEAEWNAKASERAAKVLEKLGVCCRRAAVFGDREMRIDVYGLSLDRGKLDNASLLSAFQEEFGCPFEAPAYLLLEESVILRLRRKRAITLECARAGCTKKGEVMNGDSVALFENDRDRFYALICDGMGSGREAAFTSRLASLFLEKLM